MTTLPWVITAICLSTSCGVVPQGVFLQMEERRFATEADCKSYLKSVEPDAHGPTVGDVEWTCVRPWNTPQ
jgi:hypothetical protein